MSSLRHPNICFLPGSKLPLLVMERLRTSLDDLLESMPNLPLSLKCSILEDVASGLLYLHGSRDLTSSLGAKITDMGNSRIIDMRPGQMVRTLAKLPGTLVYMPPEALIDGQRYGPPLDMDFFSFVSAISSVGFGRIHDIIVKHYKYFSFGCSIDFQNLCTQPFQNVCSCPTSV